MESKKVQYFSFTNTPYEDYGIVTIATKTVASGNKMVSIRVGFHLTDPDVKFSRRLAQKEAKIAMESNMSITMADRKQDEEREWIARSAWCCVGKDFPDTPDWAKKINLGTAAVIV